MFNVKGFDHINLNVKNLKESKRFYKDILGMDVKEEGLYNDKPWAIIGNGKAYFALYEVDDLGSVENFNHIGLHIDNFAGAEEKIRARGMKMYRDGVIEYDNSRSIYIYDPSGYQLELTEVFGGDL